MSSLKTISIVILVVVIGLISLGIVGYFFISSIPTGRVTEPLTEKETQPTKEECVPNWQCSSWSECSSAGIQTRTCTDLNNCGTVSGKPAETQTCTPTPKSYKIGDILSNDKIEFTVHSARKVFYISEYSKPEEGKVYLIVDFSIKNIGVKDGYYFNPNYVEVEDENHYTYDYSWDSYDLDKYFSDTTIELRRTKRGELAFEVPKDANKFIFILKSGFFFAREIALIDLGTVPTPQEIKSAKLTIDKVDYSWYSYGMEIGGKTGTGSIYSVDVIIENTGTLPFKPKYDLTITYAGNTIYSKTDISGLLFSDILPGKKESDTISLLMVSIDYTGTYTVKVNIKAEGETNILATATKDIIVG